MSQLVYFPYLGLKNTSVISFGDIEVWNFDMLLDQRVADTQLKAHIKKLVEANKEGDGDQRQIRNVGVVSIGSTDFRDFSNDEVRSIQELKLALFLSRLALTNTEILGSGGDGWPLATSENFEPVYQNFELGNDHLSERAGVIIPIGIGGYNLGEKRFYKPSHVLISPYGCRLDSVLLGELARLQKRQKRLFRRIMRATELVFQSYYNSPNVSYNSRILLMAAAFETLLDLDDPARKNFKNEVEKHCDLVSEQKFVHYYSKRGRKFRDKNRSIKVLWADSFFELRNQIIHGDTIGAEMFHFRGGDRQHDISILFFCLLVKKIINEKVPVPPCWDTIKWQTRKDGTEGFAYENRSVEIMLNDRISRTLR